MNAPTIFDTLKPFGKFTRIQAWTLLWEDRAAMEKALATVPTARELFIHLVRSELDNPKPVSEV